MILSTCRTQNSSPRLRLWSTQDQPARVPSPSHHGSTVPYLGLKDLGVSFREVTPNPVPGFASPEPPTPRGQSIFQGLHQAVSSTPRARHQKAGELSLGGILYPLQKQRESQSGFSPPVPASLRQSPAPSTGPQLSSHLKTREAAPDTFSIFSSPSMRRRSTGMSIPVPERKGERQTWSRSVCLCWGWERTTFPRNPLGQTLTWSQPCGQESWELSFFLENVLLFIYIVLGGWCSPICGGQRTICGSLSFSSALWVLRIDLVD